MTQTSNDNLNATAGTGAESEQKFQIQRIYVKSQSCKLPNAPSIFKNTEQPEVNIEVKAENQTLESNLYQVVLTVIVTGKSKNQTMFVTEVEQAGIFTLEGFTDEQIKQLLGAYCPTILYPYVRQVVAEMTLQASLPPVTLAPINFDAAYQEQQKQASEKKTESVQTKASETLN